MIEYQSICNAAFIRAATFESVGGTLLLVIEGNYKDRRTLQPATLDRLILEAGRYITSVPKIEDIAVSFGDAVVSWFHNPENKLQDMVAVLYCAVWVSAESVLIVHAGDIRAHVLQNGQLVAATRDHSIANKLRDGNSVKQPADHDPIPYGYDAITLRALGVGCDAYEVTRLDCPGEKTVVVCTSQVHGYRSPSDYILDLISVDSPWWNLEAVWGGYIGRIRFWP